MFKLIKFVFKTAMTLIIILCLIFGYAHLIEPFRLEANELTLSAADVTAGGRTVSGASQPFRIAVFGDTHFGFYYGCEHFDKVIEMINDEAPDIIVFTGDLIDDLNTYEGDKAEISDALTRLSAPYGKFAVYGNHDYSKSGTHIYADIMEAGGFTVLENEYFYIPELNVTVHGIDDCLIGYGQPNAVMQAASEYTFNLIVCHEPDIFDEITDYNVSLMLSGHTHGGQVRLPFFTQQFLPPHGEKYVSGMFDTDGSFLYVTKGIGTTKLPLRFGAVPEAAFITIE